MSYIRILVYTIIIFPFPVILSITGSKLIGRYDFTFVKLDPSVLQVAYVHVLKLGNPSGYSEDLDNRFRSRVGLS